MVFDQYLSRWQLVADGEPVFTPSSDLLPVRYQGKPAMLKIAREAEERAGSVLMTWWAGKGAARVLAHTPHALLLERAMGKRSLVKMAQNGQDDQASRIICSVAARLHAHRHPPPDSLVSLPQWFAALQPAASRYGGILNDSWAAAQELLHSPQQKVVLHGDLHHGNILDFGSRGWLAIDPKCLVGERGFDYANLFCNPDLTTATLPGRLARQASVVAQAAGLERERLLKWVLAWSGLSAAWTLEDEQDPELALLIGQQAKAELANI